MSDDNFTPEQKRQYDLRHYPVRPHVGVGGIIVWNQAVLIVRRKYSPNAGRWAIPGGHLKLGERAAEGALRECIEETGLGLENPRLASVIDKIDRDDTGEIEYHYVLCDYWLALASGYTQQNPPIPHPSSDALDARFVLFSDLESYDLTPTVKELFYAVNILPVG